MLKVISIYSFNQTYFFSEFDVVAFFFTPDRAPNTVRLKDSSIYSFNKTYLISEFDIAAFFHP